MYRDPEGIHSLQQRDDNKIIAANGTDASYYKSRIMSLNEEIIALNKRNKILNDELIMVGIFYLFYYCVLLRWSPVYSSRMV